MVSKDQAIGGIIFIVCVVIAIFYVITLFYPQWLKLVFGMEIEWISYAQFWVIAVPVLLAFIAVMGIGAWIGWTMATTPPPKPIEEITSEIEEKKEEEKVEEKPPEEAAPEAEEQEKPVRKRRSEK